ncbi:MAG: hypothetical protein V4714_02765 [Bacteroidota bacterium]
MKRWLCKTPPPFANTPNIDRQLAQQREAEIAYRKAREARDAEEERAGRERGERERKAKITNQKTREAWEAEENRKAKERADKDEEIHRKYIANLDGILLMHNLTIGEIPASSRSLSSTFWPYLQSREQTGKKGIRS